MATRRTTTTIVCAALALGCSGEPPDQDGDGVPDKKDDHVDVNGDGFDDRDVPPATGGSSSGGSASSGGASGSGGGAQSCVPGIPKTSQIPRLKNKEYDRTVRDLLGISGLSESGDVAPSALLATDQSGSLSDLGWSSYQTVAAQIARQVMADPASTEKFLSCDPGADGCLDQTIADFGRKAFRRPLKTEEVTAFQKLKDPALTQGGTPAEVAELILYGMLVSPSFLMRSEIEESASAGSAGEYVLSSYEVASRLSYMLWGSTPDEALNDLADQGMLSTKDQILAAAKRMLTDDKAKDMVAEFHREYLHMAPNSRWDTFVKEPTRYPAFNVELRSALSQEMEMFFEHTVFDGGTFQDLLLSTKGFANAEMAALYGLESAGLGTELAAVDLPGRPGFLTRLGFLSAYSAASRTSPIVRGAFIIKEVMGGDPGTPPPGATDTPLPDDPNLKTNRERVDQQTSAGSCARCHHEFINPPGFVLEAFDTMGVPQTNEADNGAPIDTTANVMIDGTPTLVSGPVELMTKLANSHDAAHFYAQKWVGHAFSRSPLPEDLCAVDALAVKIGAGGYMILDLIADMTQSDTFSRRAVEGVAP